MIACSLMILFKMKQAKNRVKSKQLTLNKSLDTNKHHLISKNSHFILTTLSLNITFLLFNLPITVQQLMYFYFSEDANQADPLFHDISIILFYVHFSLSFPTHLSFNACYRAELKRIISIIKEKKFFSFYSHNKTDTAENHEKNKVKSLTLSVVSTGKILK